MFKDISKLTVIVVCYIILMVILYIKFTIPMLLLAVGCYLLFTWLMKYRSHT